jgi:hypothetical protein
MSKYNIPPVKRRGFYLVFFRPSEAWNLEHPAAGLAVGAALALLALVLLLSQASFAPSVA